MAPASPNPAVSPRWRRQSHRPATFRRTLALLLVAAATACAPDAWRPDSRYDAFLDQVQDRCGNLEVGDRRIGADLIQGPDSYFLDLTSRYFHRQISPANYANALAGTFASDPGSAAIRCILAVPRSNDPMPMPMPPALLQ
ncbi:MAG TPA: hypothetical protein PK440_16440 [Candidatus Accumulibacter phosphatis]|nr:hypothetical protein [Accumulibacter sp.]HRL76897.1 hypothetical protein [Candidatus Accumulibacter phosphatis]HRQ96567.1 hypothetical protein [Candidatus Accumulibacter phosphatis]